MQRDHETDLDIDLDIDLGGSEDVDLVVLCGRVAAPPEVRHGAGNDDQTARLLVTVQTHEPFRRIDVLPVMVTSPDRFVLELATSDRVLVIGSLQRRFWEMSDGRRSRLEVVARAVSPAVRVQCARVRISVRTAE